MRFFFVPLAAVLLASGPPTLPSRGEPPRPLVILVHGRGLLGLDSASLRREWKRDLDASLAEAGMRALADTDVRLAWYADVLDPDVEAKCVAADSAGWAEIGGMVRGFLAGLASLVAQSSDTGAREARGLIGDLFYVTDATVRCAAEHRIGAVIQSAVKEKRPVILVAYSLGSVVAYEHLSKLAADAPRPPDLRLITIGSPLGVPEIRAILAGDGVAELTMPKGVTSWVNIYDPHDAFAAALERVGPRAPVDRPTRRSTTGDTHGISGYLRDAETGLALARALCAMAAERYGAACDRFKTAS